MRYLYITAMGFVTLRDEPPLTLTALQDLVGGYLEEIFSTERVPGATRMAVLDNEEGVLLNLAPSVRFPQVYSVDGVLRGAVVIMGVDEQGDQTDLTDQQLARVTVRSLPGDTFPTLHISD